MPAISPAQLYAAFFIIGIQGFGGVLPWARRVIVEQRRWLSDEQFLEQWSLCQALPGGNITNLSVAFGRRCAGPVGAAAALGGLVTGPFVVYCFLGWVYVQYGTLPEIEGIFRGISAVGAGLVLSTGIKMAATPRLRSPIALFSVAAFILTALVRWPLLAVLGTLFPLCLLYVWKRAP